VYYYYNYNNDNDNNYYYYYYTYNKNKLISHLSQLESGAAPDSSKTSNIHSWSAKQI